MNEAADFLPDDGLTGISKVAPVTLLFWVLKISATTLGETAGDLLSMTLNIGYAASTVVLMAMFVAALAVQLRAGKYHPVIFWTVILMTSTAGTTMSDYMDRSLGLGYAKGSLILVSCLLVVLAVWRHSEKTLAVSNISTTKAELFYWAAILCSNTLGTALGDFLADDSGLGFIGGATLIGGLIALIALAAFYTKINRVLLFWLAFVLTRPFGATFGDVLTKAPEKGGLGFGTVGSSLVLALILVGFTIHAVYREKAAVAAALESMTGEFADLEGYGNE